MYVCGHTYSACNAHAPYYFVMAIQWLYNIYLLYLDVTLQSTVNRFPNVSLNLEKFRILFAKYNDGIYMLLRINMSFSRQRTRSNWKIKKKNGTVEGKKLKKSILCDSLNRKAIGVSTSAVRSVPRTLTC